MSSYKKVYKIREGRVFFGVCGGIADYFNIDPLLVRLLWVFIGMGSGMGIPAYIICAIVMPTKQ